ncbi:MAG TPA: ROK family transcriptional regulator [Gemmatimonadaceae bacterium]|jgi:predicted NBD/HSP70 family sugar kinase|nr:ROK family transcriptional regulator [Gemmatimonadaceae bacterium]
MRKINTRSFRLATRSTPREVNRQIVLNLIREQQPISRAELARRMNVNRAALTLIVRELISAGDVEEVGAATVVRGRRPTLLAVRTRGRLVVAVDVRPGRTHVALADFAGQVLSREDLDTPAEPRALAERLGVRVAAILADHGTPENVHGIGVVVPGMVDRRTGKVLYAPRLGWREFQLRDALSDVAGLPVFVEGAPIACALARLWALNGKTRVVNNFAYVSVSDGVGVCIVHKGEVLRGETHTAGELGHVSLDPRGPLCVCGRRGCWEAFACNSATIARFEKLSGTRSSVEEIVSRAKLGEQAAVETLVETGRQIGRGLANVASAFNPKRIYVGGEVTAAWNLLEPAIRQALVEGTLTEVTASTPVYADPNPAEYRLLGAVALVAAPSFAAPRVG